MCNSGIHTASKPIEKRYTLASFFNQHWDAYVSNPKYPITNLQHKAVRAIKKCRTKALGKDVYSCKECGENVEIYHSCRHRFCPNCSWSDTVKWAEVVYKQLLNVPHRHVVMTLPHSLNSLIRQNPYFFYQTLLKESSNLMKDYIKSTYGVESGVISVLHTFGERKNLHVHVHMIVSWGGISKEGDSLKTIPISDRVDYPKLKESFRTRIMTCIERAYLSNDLVHNFESVEHYEEFKATLLKTPWILHLESPMNIPEQVIRYIGRYSKRACLSEYKITDISGDYITFKYKDYKQTDCNGKATEKELRLHYHDFFPLLLQHVPLTNFRLVRYYGVYATRTKILEEYKSKAAYTERSSTEEFRDDRKVCRSCGGGMQLIDIEIREGSVLWFIYLRDKRLKIRDKIAA